MPEIFWCLWIYIMGEAFIEIMTRRVTTLIEYMPNTSILKPTTVTLKHLSAYTAPIEASSRTHSISDPNLIIGYLAVASSLVSRVWGTWLSLRFSRQASGECPLAKREVPPVKLNLEKKMTAK